MYPYYIIETEKFNSELELYSTSSQLGIENLKDNTPRTYFEKKNTQILDGFIKYKLTCEIKQRKKGRALGSMDIFEEFISIDEDELYFNKMLDIIILKTRKEVFKKFCKEFESNEHLSFRKIKVDFDSIIKNQKSLGIESVWLGKIPDEVNVNSLSMYGYNIEDSSKYNQLIKDGAKIQNLSLVYDYNGKQEKVMITKDGGVILYSNMPESDALLLVEDVYDKMIKSSF